ncbi:MAG: diversity-generating retroelement protein bAvd family protein [Marinilabiliales bacterium]|nr:MAG: diversity-generating retroelement protein bAvd family protein [Marinilabiliales bacterium]
MRNFRNLEIWKKSIELVQKVYKLTKKYPDEEKFGLISQMQRASVSISSNIAEGCSRNSEIEFKRFLEIAIGSAFELETQLIIGNRLNYHSEVMQSEMIEDLHSLQKQTNSLITKISKSQQPIANSQQITANS